MYNLKLFPPPLCSLGHWDCPANTCDSSVHTHEAPLRPERAHCLPSHAGFLLDFISCPVIKGFTSAASITISFNQIKVGSALSWKPLLVLWNWDI